MERLPENEFLQYNADTLEYLRKLYNLDKPGQMDEAIDLLDGWVKKQNHFVKKDFDREYLERVIIQLKGSVERAKGQIDRICTLRTLLPKYFDKCDAKNDYIDLEQHFIMALLPKLTNEHYRVLFAKYKKTQMTPVAFLNSFAYAALLCEYVKGNDYCNGLIVVVDFRDVNMLDFVARINVMEMKEILTIFLNGYGMRVRNFLFISNSKTIEVFLKIFKQLVSEKMGSRIHVLMDIEELQRHITKELLPADYGGDEDTLTVLTDKYREVLASKENVEYFKKMSRCGTNESLRIKSTYSADFSDLAGTFRKLNVD